MHKINFLAVLVCIYFSLIGCRKDISTVNKNTNNNTFGETKAISMVIKNHPDFPSNPSQAIFKKIPTGGPEGTAANVKFTTSVKKVNDTTYEVTLTKDWNLVVNGKIVKSSWKYIVTPNNVELSESADNDDLPIGMK